MHKSPITTKEAANKNVESRISPSSNQPKKIANIGLKKEKLATPEAG